MPSLSVSIQPEDFDIGQEHLRLRAQDERVGAVCSFLGTVRSQNEGLSVAAMTLEHYPGMTEKAILSMLSQAGERFDIYAAIFKIYIRDIFYDSPHFMGTQKNIIL